MEAHFFIIIAHISEKCKLFLCIKKIPKKFILQIILCMKKFDETEKSLADAEKVKAEVSGNYQTYLRQVQTDYDFILGKIKREQEDIKQAEQERQTWAKLIFLSERRDRK